MERDRIAYVCSRGPFGGARGTQVMSLLKLLTSVISVFMVSMMVSTSQLTPSVTMVAAQSQKLLQQSASAGEVAPAAMTTSNRGSDFSDRHRRFSHLSPCTG